MAFPLVFSPVSLKSSNAMAFPLVFSPVSLKSPFPCVTASPQLEPSALHETLTSAGTLQSHLFFTLYPSTTAPIGPASSRLSVIFAVVTIQPTPFCTVDVFHFSLSSPLLSFTPSSVYHVSPAFAFGLVV